MIDFQLDKRRQEIVEKYRDFSNRWIVPNRMKYDVSATFPWEIVKAAYDENIIHASVPVEFGGQGFNILDGALASEELGYGCTGIGICVDASTLAITPLLLMGSDEQKKRIFGELFEKKTVAAYALTEPSAGSDVQGIKSTAIKKGDKYILNGHKRFITNGEVAEYITVFALAEPERGSRSLSALAVHKDTPGITIAPRLDKMGQRASVQNEIMFENAEVPAINLIGGEGYGFLIAMKTFDRTRTGVAAAAVGNAQAALIIHGNGRRKESSLDIRLPIYRVFPSCWRTWPRKLKLPGCLSGVLPGLMIPSRKISQNYPPCQNITPRTSR